MFTIFKADDMHASVPSTVASECLLQGSDPT